MYKYIFVCAGLPPPGLRPMAAFTVLMCVWTRPPSRRVGTVKNFRQERNMGTDLYHSTALVEAAKKNLASSNV